MLEPEFYCLNGGIIAIKKGELWMKTMRSKWSFLGCPANFERIDEESALYFGKVYKRVRTHQFRLPGREPTNGEGTKAVGMEAGAA